MRRERREACRLLCSSKSFVNSANSAWLADLSELGSLFILRTDEARLMESDLEDQRFHLAQGDDIQPGDVIGDQQPFFTRFPLNLKADIEYPADRAIPIQAYVVMDDGGAMAQQKSPQWQRSEVRVLPWTLE